MKAFVVERYGDADTVRAGDVPDPTAGAHDVLVQIHAASVNPVDIKIRDGDLKTILPTPPSPRNSAPIPSSGWQSPH